MSENYVELDFEHIGDRTLESVQEEFDIDFTNLVHIPQTSPTYHRLTRDDINSVIDTLKEKYSEDGVSEIETLFQKMKRGSYEPETSQTYEWLVREALRVPGYIRGGGSDVQDLPDDSDQIYCDHYRITQAFLRNEFRRTPTLYRGLWPEEFRPLVRAMLDNAYASAFASRSPIVTSFTLSKGIADNFCDGVTIEWPLQDNAVAFSADFLRQPPRSCQPEAEMHVLSGEMILAPKRFKLSLSVEKPLIWVIQRMTTPAGLPQEVHSDLLTLLEGLVNSEIQTETIQATNRLWTWYRYCEREGIFTGEQLELAEAVVTFVSGERDWRPET